MRGTRYRAATGAECRVGILMKMKFIFICISLTMCYSSLPWLAGSCERNASGLKEKPMHYSLKFDGKNIGRDFQVSQRFILQFCRKHQI